jgi:SnoaL-like domain
MSLEERVARLEAEREIVRTLYQYAHTLDYGPEAEFLDCFVEEGSWERTRARRPGDVARFDGLEGLTRFFNDPHRGRAPEVYFKHLVAEPRIAFDGEEADVLSYYVRIQEHPDGPYVFAFGRYRDRLRRCPDGRWRFVSRLAETEDTHAR